MQANQDLFAWVAVSSRRIIGETLGGVLAHAEMDAPDMLIVAVCDGIGGMRNGEKAMAIVCDGLVE